MPAVNPGPASTSSSNALVGTLPISGYLLESFVDNIACFAGGGQLNATPLVAELNRITTVTTAGDSVKLPASFAGLTIFVVNHGANNCQVFGNGTDTIDDVATATGISQQANSTVLYFCSTAGAWYTEGLATGFVRGLALQTLSPAQIAASTTNTQVAGTPITAMLTTITATSNPGAVTLPPSSPGMNLTLMAVTAADAISVFPNAGGTGTETINALAANAAFSMTALTSVTFNCVVAGQWYTVPRTAS